MAQTLVTSRYVGVGVYIGELLQPRPGNLSADARLANYIGRGSRLALASNQPIRRAFVYGEELSFTNVPPFVANVVYPTNGGKDNPVRLFKTDGTEVRADQWEFVKVGDDYTQVMINTEVFDQIASYKMDYQAVDRLVLDPLPVAGLRQIKAVGNSADQPQYNEYTDFFIKSSLTSPVFNGVNETSDVSVITFVGSGTGAVAYNVGNQFNHDYNRDYELKVVSTGATVVFEWSATPISGGNDSLPAIPLHSAEDKPQISVSAPGAIDIELGLKLDISSLSGFALDDVYSFKAFGPALVEVDKRFNSTNQYVWASDISESITGTGTVAYASNSLYSGLYNVKFVVKCVDSTPTTATFVWAKYGESYVSGTFVVNTAVPASLTQTLVDGIKLTFGNVSGFAIDDQYDFEVKAPRIFVTAKDSRNYTMTVGTAAEGLNYGTVTGSFVTNTPEGRFGTFSADSRVAIGRAVLPDNITLAFRNLFKNRFTADDEMTFVLTDDEVIDWSLTKKLEETKESTEILHDITGGVTGTPNTYYITLKFTPTTGTVVVKKQSDSSVIPSTPLADTPFVAFGSTSPATAMVVSYEFKGMEPDPGQVYFFSALYIRPVAFYNTPQLVLSVDDGRSLVAPSQVDNHLYMMNELAFENGAPGLYVSQVKDADDDGIYSDTDFRTTVLASEHVSRITDQVVLSNWNSTSDLLAVNVKANDPFEKREQLAWFGMPTGTEVGDIDTPDTIVYTARRTLQVYGNSPAHGTRILVAPTYCKRTTVLDGGFSKQVTLDGSFVAGALAALSNSFADPAETVLRKQLAGFDEIQVYTEPENIILGGASTVYFSDLGAKVFQVEEDVTVDTTSAEFNLISAMTQKQFVVKVVRREMDSALISIVAPSAQAGVGLTRATLSGILLGLLGRGLVAPYQDANGNERKFDPNADIVVFRDSEDPTLYHFMFCFFLRYPIKRLYGLYSVNGNDFGASIA